MPVSKIAPKRAHKHTRYNGVNRYLAEARSLPVQLTTFGHVLRNSKEHQLQANGLIRGLLARAAPEVADHVAAVNRRNLRANRMAHVEA